MTSPIIQISHDLFLRYKHYPVKMYSINESALYGFVLRMNHSIITWMNYEATRNKGFLRSAYRGERLAIPS